MDTKLKQYCDRLQEEAKIAETSLARVRQHLFAPEATSLADWKALLRLAALKCQAKREQAEQAGQRVKVWLEEMQRRAGVPFDDSNLDREVSKAERQADREEGLALDAMLVAAHAALQAEAALLKAFKTRRNALDLERFRDVF